MIYALLLAYAVIGLLLGLVYFLVKLQTTERAAVAAERADLLQRIQAPEVAVIRHDLDALPPDPLPLAYDDDAAFHQSREEMADALARIERAG